MGRGRWRRARQRDRTSEFPADIRRDRISELPDDILDKILVLLNIQEAARLAVLSTNWRNIWLNLTELDFGYDFFFHILEKYYNDEKENIDIWTSMGFYVINKVLMQHNGLIRKFAFCFPPCSFKEFSYRSFGFDQWLPFVTENGVEEIHISAMPNDEYNLPNCIFSCLTLRSLHLDGITVEQLNAHCTLPNLTSLCFKNVHFDGGDFLLDAPMLDNLSFVFCDTVSEINITAQKVSSLEIIDCHLCQLFDNLGLESVRTLQLDYFSLKDFVCRFTRRGLQQQPPALNVEHLILSSNYKDRSDDISSAFIHLLRICPKICQLDIDLDFSRKTRDCFYDPTRRLSKEFHTVAQRHKMLHTLNLDTYIWRDTDNLFIMGLLDCFPALEKVVITPASPISRDKDSYSDLELKQLELFDFPCASTKAEIIFGYKNPWN